MIQSGHSAFGVCPTWPLLAAIPTTAHDEGTWRDGALLLVQREPIAHARVQLLRVLTEAFERDPRADWVAGQLVRFQLDARDVSGARRTTQRCAAQPWWCSALTGLVHARAGEIPQADAAFAHMRATMPASLRCSWNDVSLLLADADRSRYVDIGCTQRDSLHERLWWMADPLWRDAGNARLVEQEVRRVELHLRQQTMQDERYSFDDERGGDAIRKLLLQYGWPSYTAWGGQEEDRQHSAYLQRSFKSPPAVPYTSFEYSPDRIRSLPAWRALTSPYAAASSDWSLGVEDSLGQPATTWWPAEHFRPARRLVQLPDGQIVSVRRQSYVEVVTALRLVHPAVRFATAPFDVIFLATTGPAQIDSLDRQTASSGSTVVLRGAVRHTPTLLGIEASGMHPADIDARTRYGYTPPTPLAMMQARDIAVSDVALLSPRTETELHAPNDQLLQHLLPDQRLPAETRRTTLYWESYGTTPQDSATIVLRLASDQTLSVWRRMGMATGVLADPGAGIEIRWKDHEARGGTTTLRGPVPVQMRALQLDLGALRPGVYAIEVTMQLRDGRAASSRTTLELVQ